MKIYPIESIDKIQQPVFFDANILIYLFWPTGKVSYENSYAKAFNSLRKKGTKMVINFSVISEVVNRMLRIEYNKLKTAEQRFKVFRNSHQGEEALNDIYELFKNVILVHFEVCNSYFDKSLIETFLKYDSLDFNDKAIVEVCHKENFILLTNDTDFKDQTINILSCHPAFFK